LYTATADFFRYYPDVSISPTDRLDDRKWSRGFTSRCLPRASAALTIRPGGFQLNLPRRTNSGLHCTSCRSIFDIRKSRPSELHRRQIRGHPFIHRRTFVFMHCFDRLSFSRHAISVVPADYTGSLHEELIYAAWQLRHP
jgi:hypothetical protein